MKKEAYAIAVLVLLCPTFALAGMGWFDPTLPLEPKTLEVVPALQHLTPPQEPKELAGDCHVAGENYAYAVARYGPESAEARAAAADYEAACGSNRPGETPARQ